MRLPKKIFNILFSRLFIVGLMLMLQIAIVFTIVVYFSLSTFVVYLFCNLISIVVVIGLVSRDEQPDFKITWIISILSFPIFGGIFYLLFAYRRIPHKLRRQIESSHQNIHDWIPFNQLSPHHPHDALLSDYIHNLTGYPVCENTTVEYFPIGEQMFERMLEEMEKAERFIFMEFFIVKPGIMWDAVFELMSRKVSEGVEVFFMYDDIGSISTMNKKMDRAIMDAGIRLCLFNRFRPHASTMLNHRDHRKILVVDGKTAFCGGINIADEYINHLVRFGHWKDTGIMLKGDAAWPFSLMFLQQWRFASGEEVDMSNYRPNPLSPQPTDGQVQVFGDSPLDRYNVTETAYIGSIVRAERYIYITTPYLVIDNAMRQALCNAAISGVDVRIITPYHYDKWYVHVLTRSNYAALIRSGVKIYEYTPGFMHGKMFVTDDRVCMVGTCNMDFRSFHLHFECSALMYESSAIFKVKKDMLDSMKLSHLVDFIETQDVSIPVRILRAILKVFAPLM